MNKINNDIICPFDGSKLIQKSNKLNGKSLEHELLRRDYANLVDAYWGQWLEFVLEEVRPTKGENTLSITLNKRAEGCIGTLVIEDAETIVEYHPFRSRL